MDLKQLSYFVHVAELGSFTRASGVLRIAQPALSRQVRALEVELRQTLLTRNGRGVVPTEAGKRLLGHGRGILLQVERAAQDLEDHRGAPVGRFALGVPPSVGRLLTAPLVTSFRARFPKATLSVVEGLSTYLLEWLQQGRIDCAAVYNVTPSAAVELSPVLQERLYLVSGRASASARRRRTADPAVSLDVLADHDLVIPSRPHAIRMQLEAAMAAASLKPRIALEIESVPAMLELVEAGGLHAVLTSNALQGREATLEARPVTLGRGQALATTLWLATSSQRPSGAIVQQGEALVREQLLALLAAA